MTVAPTSPKPNLSLLEGSWDAHVHFGPELVTRAQDFLEIARDAKNAGMAGIVLKDHCGSTLHACHAASVSVGGSVQFPPSLTLNHTVGGLNPIAVEVALRSGVQVVWFPTFSSLRQLESAGSMPYPIPERRNALNLRDEKGRIRSEVHEIVDLIAQYDATLATGHLSAREGLDLVRLGRGRGVERMVITHASLSVTDMHTDLQQQAIEAGSFIEHCLHAASDSRRSPLPMSGIADQIEKVGHERIVLTSDFGQTANGPPVPAFAHYLQQLIEAGIADDRVRRMITQNPAQLFGRR